MMASSNRSPPIRAEAAYTMPFSESAVTSEVPPPMSSTIEPRASFTGRPAPTAAAMGSLTICTLRAPAPSADFLMARRFTWVAVIVLHRDNGRLIEHDALVTDVNEGIGRPQVDRQITREIATQAFEHEVAT